MQEGLSIFIASGSTSNLFASCFSALSSNYTIYAKFPRIRNDAMRHLEATVRFVVSVEEMPTIPHCILWLSPHDDIEALKKYSFIAPTLAMSSGAVTAFLQGKQTRESLNAYQRSKLAILEEVEGLSAFIPGFFLEDVDLPRWASRGLHGDTTQKLFSSGPVPQDLDLKKCYSVTPKSYIVRAIKAWVDTPLRGQHFCVCSNREFYRWELRLFAGLLLPADFSVDHPTEGAFGIPAPIYENMDHILERITDEHVFQACKRVYASLKN